MYSHKSIRRQFARLLLLYYGSHMSFGDRLRQERDANGWTQNELAARCGVKQGTISRIERGDQAESVHTPKLAAALGVNALWLAIGEGPREASVHTGTGALPAGSAGVGGEVGVLTPRQQAVLGLFDGLTESQQEAFLRELEATQHDNEQRFAELLKIQQRRSRDAG